MLGRAATRNHHATMHPAGKSAQLAGFVFRKIPLFASLYSTLSWSHAVQSFEITYLCSAHTRRLLGWPFLRSRRIRRRCCGEIAPELPPLYADPSTQVGRPP